MLQQHKLTSNTITTLCENSEEQGPYTMMDTEEIVVVEPTDPDEDRMREQQQQQELQEQYRKQQQSQIFYKILTDLQSARSTTENFCHTTHPSESATKTISLDGVDQSTSLSTPHCSIPLTVSSEVTRMYDVIKKCTAPSHVPVLLLQSPALLKTSPTKSVNVESVTESVHPFVKSMLTNCVNVNLVTQQVMSVSAPVNAPTVQGLNNIVSGHNAILIFYKSPSDFSKRSVTLVPDQNERITSSHSFSETHDSHNVVLSVPSTALTNSNMGYIGQFSSDGIPKCKVEPQHDVVPVPVNSSIGSKPLTNGNVEPTIGRAGLTDDATSQNAPPKDFHLHLSKKRRLEHDLKEVRHNGSLNNSHVSGCHQNIVSSNIVKKSENGVTSVTLDISPTCDDDKHSQSISSGELFDIPLDSTSSPLNPLIKTEEKSPSAANDNAVDTATNVLKHTCNKTVPSKRILPVIAPKVSAQPITRPWSPIYLNPGVPRPHRCPVEECGMAFAKLGRLRDHIYRHFAKRPFICDQCPASFVRMYDLRRHGKAHL